MLNSHELPSLRWFQNVQTESEFCSVLDLKQQKKSGNS